MTTLKQAICVLLFVIATSFVGNAPKKYKFEFNEQEVSALWNVVDQSNAPHQQVEAVKKIIQDQYAAQTDTTKQKK